MTYQFPPDVDQLLKAQMATGGYASQDDVLRDALRALEELTYYRPDPNAGRISSEALCAEVQRGIDQLDRGEGLDAEEVFDGLLRDLPDPDET